MPQLVPPEQELSPLLVLMPLDLTQYLGSVSRAGALPIDICIIFFCVFVHADLLNPQQQTIQENLSH